MMKKICLCVLVAVLLCGCSAEPAWETVEDIVPVETVPTALQLYIPLPEDASQPTFQEETAGELYLCDGYTLTKQTLQSGDLSKTVKSICGLDKEQVQLMKTVQDGQDRYDFVWTAAGEDGLQLGRACILDDGNYHYAVSTMAGEETAGQLRETWQDIFSCCRLISPTANLSTGS